MGWVCDFVLSKVLSTSNREHRVETLIKAGSTAHPQWGLQLEKVTQRVSTTTLDPPTLAHVMDVCPAERTARDLRCIHMFYTCSCNNSEELYIVHHGTWSAADKQVTLPFDLKHLDVQQHLDGRP
jgi:hypothetical protein